MKTTERTRKAKIIGSDKRLMLVSWGQLLGSMAIAVANDTGIASDIQQLHGLARYQDEEAFQPIHPEEFGLALPRRVRGLSRLIDDAIDTRGVPQGWMTTKGLRATPQREGWEGYGRYFRFTDPSSGGLIPGDLFLCVHYLRWARSGETPLWLWIGNAVPVNIARMRDRVPSLVENERWGTCDVPIYLQTGVEYERVLDDVVRQVRAIGDMLAEP